MYIIAGKFHRHRIESPKGDETRPTASRLRESFFNIVQQEIEDADFLDIFAGSGAMGLEALSRGAKHATFIENHRSALYCLETNLKKLNVKPQATVLAGDFQKMLEFLGRRGSQFNLIFADAPYAMTQTSIQLVDLITRFSLLKQGGKVFIEDTHTEAPEVTPSLVLINSRRSGKTFLHQLQKV